jgi:hypothetical protein
VNYKESEGKKQKIARDVNYKWQKKSALVTFIDQALETPYYKIT